MLSDDSSHTVENLGDGILPLFPHIPGFGSDLSPSCSYVLQLLARRLLWDVGMIRNIPIPEGTSSTLGERVVALARLAAAMHLDAVLGGAKARRQEHGEPFVAQMGQPVPVQVLTRRFSRE